MPLEVRRRPLVERVRRLRRYPWGIYAFAIATVAVATALRALVQPMLTGVPFITFYPAVIVSTLVGGLRPGLLALALSSLAAWYFFLPPFQSWQLTPDAAFALLMFEAVSGINITVIVLLDQTLAHLSAQEENIRLLVEASPAGIVVVDGGGNITLVNASSERMFGYPRNELLGKPVELLVPKPFSQPHRSYRATFQARPEARMMGAGRDLTALRKDGSEFPVEIGLNPVSRNGQTNIVASIIDITARRRIQEQQQLLIKELQHRTRNILAVVSAIVGTTLVQGRPLAEIRYTLTNRFRALAQAYDLVAETGWQGASLKEMLERQLAGYSERIAVEGCEMEVNVSAAQQFAMIVHELTTNALKYGALSTSDGRVVISGKGDGDGSFLFVWREAGGPDVSPPARKGFGSVVLAAGGFGQVNIEYQRTGLRYELSLELDTIRPSRSSAGSSVRQRASSDVTAQAT